MSAEWEDLGAFGLRFVQPTGVARFGTDSVLLSDFAARRLRSDSRVADICAGSGIIALLMAARHPAYVAAVELDPAAADAAKTNARINTLAVDVLCADIRTAPLQTSSFDLITCNPPYFTESSRVSPDPSRRQARSEGSCTFSDAARSASRALRCGGYFFAVYRPERLTDALLSMRQANLEPKVLRFAAYTADHAPFAVLLEGKKGARPGLKIEPLLTMQSAEASAIYRGRYDTKEQHGY